MSSWNGFFRGNSGNQLPEWMTLNVDTSASPVIRYPAQDESNYYVYTPAYSYTGAPAVTTMVLKVPICCEGCEERVKSRLIDIDGVQGVKCDQLQHKVTVTGTASPHEILRECKKLFKRSNWWPSQ